MNGLDADPLTDQDFLSLRCPSCGTPVDFLLTLAGTAQGCPCCVNPIVLPRRRGEAASKIPLPMKGESVVLRRLTEGDAEALCEFWEFGDDAERREWLQTQAMHQLTEEGRQIHLGVQIRETRVLAGSFTLNFTDDSHRQAAFYLIENKGRITDALFKEACGVLFILCFGALHLHRLTSAFTAEVPEFQKRCLLLESLGMRKEGHFRKDHWEDEAWGDSVRYAYLDEEYNKVAGSR